MFFPNPYTLISHPLSLQVRSVSPFMVASNWSSPQCVQTSDVMIPREATLLISQCGQTTPLGHQTDAATTVVRTDSGDAVHTSETEKPTTVAETTVHIFDADNSTADDTMEEQSMKRLPCLFVCLFIFTHLLQ